MKASPEQQRILLDVADLDQRSARAQQRSRKPAQAERLAELTALRQEQLRALTEKTGVQEDARAELRRLEADVELAEQRRARDAERLAASTNPKDAQALEREIAALAVRVRTLEDAQLEVMGRVEEAEESVSAQQALIDATVAEGTELTTAAKADMAAAAEELQQITADRARATAGVEAALLADYERRAQRTAGAALLRRGTCEGCRMVLSGIDLGAIRQAQEDDVISCPECGCILVRTEESGL